MSNPDEHNRRIFDAETTVADYAGAADVLTPCEEMLFERHFVEPGAVLDLGVGTGRTTTWLQPRATSYVGIDYAEQMVAVARRRHPASDLRVGDAADLSEFTDASFDAVVFSYNGLDYLHPAEKRHRCLDEVHRVLHAGGVFVFSSHNPRAVLRRPDSSLRHEWGSAKYLGVAALASARAALRFVPTGAFWRGDGYVTDSARPLLTHMATPARVVADLAAHGFEVVETAGSLHPAPFASLRTPWVYYAARKVSP